VSNFTQIEPKSDSGYYKISR